MELVLVTKIREVVIKKMDPSFYKKKSLSIFIQFRTKRNYYRLLSYVAQMDTLLTVMDHLNLKYFKFLCKYTKNIF